MDFVSGLLRRNRQRSTLMVVVDKLTELVHFIPVFSRHTTSEIVAIFLKEIARLYGVPKCYHFQLRHQVRFQILANFVSRIRHQIEVQQGRTFRHGRIDRKSKLAIGGSSLNV